MNRRGFLKLFATAAPTYFLPPIGGWSSDVIVHPGIPGRHYDILKYDDVTQGPITYNDLLSGGQSRYIHLTYGLGMRISKQLLEEQSNLNRLLNQRLDLNANRE
jgi:hypothetical protein